MYERGDGDMAESWETADRRRCAAREQGLPLPRGRQPRPRVDGADFRSEERRL